MRNYLLFLFTCLSLLNVCFAQEKPKMMAKEIRETDRASKMPDETERESKNSYLTISPHDRIVWEGTSDVDGGKPQPTTSQPAPVKAAFEKDFPLVESARWSKYRGDWTATFINGAFTSTAVYHANGSRRDTRTSLQPSQLPTIVFTNIKERSSDINIVVAVKIEVPGLLNYVFRVKTVTDGVARFLFYNSEGKEVPYNY